jgi:cell division protein ZapE
MQGAAEADFPAQLERAAAQHGFELDAAQKRVALAFQRLAEELGDNGGVLDRLLGRKRAVRGIYLWGAVGRGKSFLMDEFFRLLPLKAKHRVHFHRFMQGVHHELRELQGRADPLQIVAQRLAQDARVVCLDELHITDIGDAMLMRGLLSAMFERGIALVTTSNQHPDDLYEHGLQRAQFEPAIELLKACTEVIELDGEHDYRLRTLERAGVYHWPLDPGVHASLEQAFAGVAGEDGERDVAVEIEGRTVRALRLAPGTAWFEFRELCEGPRGTADYIELARRYHTVLLSGVRCFAPGSAQSMRRFTWLIDEFYDRRVKLIISAEGSPEKLLAQVPVTPDVERTRSRLIEMQTPQYLSRAHLA